MQYFYTKRIENNSDCSKEEIISVLKGERVLHHIYLASKNAQKAIARPLVLEFAGAMALAMAAVSELANIKISCLGFYLMSKALPDEMS